MKALSFTMLAALLVGIQTSLAVCPGDGTNSAVVGEYLFPEGAGSDTINTGIDGDDGNASLTNGAVFSADVPTPNQTCGWSIHLPSSGSGGTTPALESILNYDPLSGADSFTIMAWVRRQSGGTGSNQSARIFSDASSLALTSSTAGVELRFSGSSGTLALRVNGNEVSTTVGGLTPTNDAWRHVAVVYDGTRPATNTITRNVHFYVDAIQRGDGNTLQGISVAANTNRMTLGNSSVGRTAANLLVGKLDDVVVLYNYAPVAVGNGKTNDELKCYMNWNDDLEPPVVVCPADLIIGAEPGLCIATNVNLGLATATDNCGVTNLVNNAPANFPTGTTVVTWSAWDLAGNYGSCDQLVTVRDETPPTIVCPSNLVLEAGPCLVGLTNVNLGQATGFDDCGTVSMASEGPAIFTVGTTSVIWRIWDTSGNTNSCTQQVTVRAHATADCDKDGLTDREEVENYFSEPTLFSTAGDGFGDGWKVQHMLNPTSALPVSCRPKYW
jgi:hypothetical protein